MPAASLGFKSADLVRELGCAERLARAAGAAVMELYGSARPDRGTGGSPVTAADRASNRVIVTGLKKEFPNDALLSEESPDVDDRLANQRVWIVDPLDGTEFLAENGEFAVMIGLTVRGRLALGVVYLPADDVLYHAVRGQGAWVERGSQRMRLEPPPPDLDSLRLLVSRFHRDPLTDRMEKELEVAHSELCGSVGVKCGRIAEGRGDLCIHPVPYLKEWDTCVPEVVICEAGGTVTDCRGHPLPYNKAEPFQSDGIVVCAPGLSTFVLDRIATLWSAPT